MNRWTGRVVSFLIAAFGVACLHFNEAGGAEHHREWAVEYGMPEPSYWMWVMGAVATLIGAGWMGFACGRCCPLKSRRPDGA